MKIFKKVLIVLFVGLFALSAAARAQAATAVNLGTAGNFAVLAGSGITNSGPSSVSGDVGVSPGSSITGFPPGTINGTQHVNDAAAAQAQVDLLNAYNGSSAQPMTASVSGDLGGMTLTPGVYNSATSLSYTGTLTLDGQGNPNAIFIFQIAGSLITTPGSTLRLINGAQAQNVFWQIGSSATFSASSNFSGIVMALDSITVQNGSILNARLLAHNGSVALAVPVATPFPPIIPTLPSTGLAPSQY